MTEPTLPVACGMELGGGVEDENGSASNGVDEDGSAFHGVDEDGSAPPAVSESGGGFLPARRGRGPLGGASAPGGPPTDPCLPRGSGGGPVNHPSGQPPGGEGHDAGGHGAPGGGSLSGGGQPACGPAVAPDRLQMITSSASATTTLRHHRDASSRRDMALVRRRRPRFAATTERLTAPPWLGIQSGQCTRGQVTVNWRAETAADRGW